MRDRHRRNRLHRLNGHRRPKVQTRHHGEKAEARKDALWVEAIDRDVADDEWDQCAEVPEGPYEPGTADVGVNRLISSMLAGGIGPNQNVYAELGTTWWSVMSSPDQAAHVLGKLLKNVGEDNVLWGTDALFYGAPQDQIQAFRAFQISAEYQERFGYPALTDEIKRKVLGLNALRLHDVDPITAKCQFTRDELEQIRQTLPTGNETFGPRTTADQRAYVAHHQATV